MWLEHKLYEYEDVGRVDAQLNPAIAIQRNQDRQDYEAELSELHDLLALIEPVSNQWTHWQRVLVVLFVLSALIQCVGFLLLLRAVL